MRTSFGSEPLSSIRPVRIRCHDLRVQFPDGSIGLANVECEFPAGEITAIIGPSGCGKSTLLRAVAGLVDTAGGEVQFDRRPLTPRRGELAFVFQDAALIPWRTSRENVRLPLELTRCPAAKRDELITQQLRLVELDEADDDKVPAQLSGGMRMRVSIARGLVTDPSVLLLDEPFAALDELLRTRLGELLISLWQRRARTILFVTHNIAEAVLLSHRVVVMSGGTTTATLINPLPFPRDASIRGQPAFGQFYQRLATRLAEAAS